MRQMQGRIRLRVPPFQALLLAWPKRKEMTIILEGLIICRSHRAKIHKILNFQEYKDIFGPTLEEPRRMNGVGESWLLGTKQNKKVLGKVKRDLRILIFLWSHESSFLLKSTYL